MCVFFAGVVASPMLVQCLLFVLLYFCWCFVCAFVAVESEGFALVVFAFLVVFYFCRCCVVVVGVVALMCCCCCIC